MISFSFFPCRSVLGNSTCHVDCWIGKFKRESSKIQKINHWSSNMAGDWNGLLWIGGNVNTFCKYQNLCKML